MLRYESMIHEFDPYFNYRTTRFLSEEGFYAFHNWFDDRAWYPLGRIIGGTIYPGLMVTSAVFTYILNLGTTGPCSLAHMHFLPLAPVLLSLHIWLLFQAGPPETSPHHSRPIWPTLISCKLFKKSNGVIEVSVTKFVRERVEICKLED